MSNHQYTHTVNINILYSLNFFFPRYTLRENAWELIVGDAKFICADKIYQQISAYFSLGERSEEALSRFLELNDLFLLFLPRLVVSSTLRYFICEHSTITVSDIVRRATSAVASAINYVPEKFDDYDYDDDVPLHFAVPI